MKKSEKAAQARRELDRRLSSGSLDPLTARPRLGWIRAVRGGLGMSQSVLGRRLGVSAAAISLLEKSEASETISMGRLANVARALDCTLVYALVPNSSLEETVQRQARSESARTLRYVDATMLLEDQSLSSDRRANQIDQLAAQLIDTNQLWAIE